MCIQKINLGNPKGEVLWWVQGKALMQEVGLVAEGDHENGDIGGGDTLDTRGEAKISGRREFW